MPTLTKITESRFDAVTAIDFNLKTGVNISCPKSAAEAVCRDVNAGAPGYTADRALR